MNGLVLHPDEYLDARRPEWFDVEQAGRVRYDRSLNAVVIDDAPILAALKGDTPR